MTLVDAGVDVLIVDTAGRLHLDDALMTEIRSIAAAVERFLLSAAGLNAMRSASRSDRL